VAERKTVVPRSLNQRRYLEEIAKSDMVFGIARPAPGRAISPSRRPSLT